MIKNHIKILILLASLVAFVYLVVKADINRPLVSKWDQEKIDLLLKWLELDDLDVKDGECRSGKQAIVTVFPSESLADILWGFFSLMSIRDGVAYLPYSNRWKLSQIFDGVGIPALNDVSRKCYDISETIVLTNTSGIEELGCGKINILVKGGQIADIFRMDWGEIRKKFEFNPQLLQSGNNQLKVLSPFNRKEFVGIYIQNEDNIPFDYYFNAMTFQMKRNKARLVFVIVCDDLTEEWCLKSFSPLADTFVTANGTEAENFVLMSMCNHTIISNELGSFHALLNGGVATFYGNAVRDYGVENWFSVV